MKRLLPFLAVALFVLLPSHGRAAERLPNIVFLLADDLGYGDLGAFGQTKIRTPNLDKLAADGVRLTRHYSGNAVCAPSRCVLMTGKHPGHAYIRDNRELQPEGQVPIGAGESTLAQLLQRSGYATGAFGKWGLGGPGSEGEPLKKGFDRFYGYNCQRVAHSFYPTSLWDNATRVVLNNPPFPAHQKLPPGADTNSPATYAGFIGQDYAPDRITAESLRFIDAHAAKPFFLFYPTTVPHLALQVPEDSLAEYAGKFPEAPYLGDRSYLPHRTPRAAYAAMVTRMDRDIGRLLDALKRHGLEENTIVVFSSDNGPLYGQLGGTDTDFFNSASGFRGRKGSLYEGGLHVPTIVRWTGRIAAGRTVETRGGFEDWMPTLLELASLKDRIPAGIDGRSLAPALLGRAQPEREFLYREFPAYGGQQAVWAGRWKAIRQNLNPTAKAKKKSATPVTTELYDIEADPHETRNVAADYPDVVARLDALMKSQHTPSAVFPFAALDR